MKINLDSDDLSDIDPAELTGLEHVLQGFLRMVRTLQGRTDIVETPAKEPESELPADEVGDVIIEGFKLKQLKAMTPRRESGWMKTGFDRVDDKHI